MESHLAPPRSRASRGNTPSYEDADDRHRHLVLALGRISVAGPVTTYVV